MTLSSFICHQDIYVIYRPRGPDREILARGHDRGQVSPYPDRGRQVNSVFVFLHNKSIERRQRLLTYVHIWLDDDQIW